MSSRKASSTSPWTSYRPNNSRGFTLIEILVVLSLGLILISSTYFLSIGTIRSFAFQRAHATVKQELWRARTDTMSQTQDSNWGVIFSGHTITRYRGDSYSARAVEDDVIHVFDETLTFAGTEEIPFIGLDGSVSSTHSVVLTDQSRTATTTVYSSGAIMTP